MNTKDDSFGMCFCTVAIILLNLCVNCMQINIHTFSLTQTHTHTHTLHLAIFVCFSFQEIDSYIAKASDQGYSALVSLGTKGFSYATNIVLSTAIKVNQSLHILCLWYRSVYREAITDFVYVISHCLCAGGLSCI